MTDIDAEATDAVILEAMIRTLTYVLNLLRRVDHEMETDLLSMIDRFDDMSAVSPMTPTTSEASTQ